MIRSLYSYLLTAALLAAPACHAGDNQGFFAKIKNWWEQQCGYRTIEKQNTFSQFEYRLEDSFDKLIGHDAKKAKFENTLAYAENPAKYASIADYISTNFVFYGEPHTGKSSFASALAGEMKKRNPHMHILKIPSALFRELGVQQAIDLIHAYAPCVVIIDELPYTFGQALYASEVEAGRLTKSEAQNYVDALKENTLNIVKLLQQHPLSTSPSKPVFMFFTSCNVRPCDAMCHSGLPGSIQFVQFTPLSKTDRTHIIHTLLEKEYNEYNSESFDLALLSEKTDGLYFAEIRHFIRTALYNAHMKNKSLTTAHIIDAINTNPNRKNVSRLNND